MKILHTAIVVAAVSLLLSLSLDVEARLRDFANLRGIGDIDFGSWAAGDGNQNRTDLHCAASSNYNNRYNDPPPVKNPAAVHLPYNFRVENRDTSGTFYIYLNGDVAMTGNSRIQVSMSHRDIKVGTGYEVLGDSVYDAHAHNGQFSRCNNGDNSELMVSILSSEMEKARAGSYSARFRAQIQGGTSGTKTSRKNFVVSANIADIVMISRMDNINLGNWAGGAGIVREEDLLRLQKQHLK